MLNNSQIISTKDDKKPENCTYVISINHKGHLGLMLYLEGSWIVFPSGELHVPCSEEENTWFHTVKPKWWLDFNQKNSKECK